MYVVFLFILPYFYFPSRLCFLTFLSLFLSFFLVSVSHFLLVYVLFVVSSLWFLSLVSFVLTTLPPVFSFDWLGPWGVWSMSCEFCVWTLCTSLITRVRVVCWVEFLCVFGSYFFVC